jgi:predicted dehydrogenase
VSDPSSARLEAARQLHPWIQVSNSIASLLADPEIDALAVATPADTHAQVALAALRAGKHVLVEKPLTTSSDDALALVEESERRHLVLMVDHTHLFSPSIGAVAQLLAQGTIGTLRRYTAVRTNTDSVRTDVNAIWDLAVHDLSILGSLVPAPPETVRLSGVRREGGGLESAGLLELRFPGALEARIKVDWIAAAKSRRVAFEGDRGTIVYDDLEASNKVRIYGPGGSWSPLLEPAEPLGAVVNHFLTCIASGQRPLTDGLSALRIVRLLEAAMLSMREGGRVVELTEEGVAV